MTDKGSSDQRTHWAEVAAVVIVWAVMTVNSAMAPSTTPADSQWRQMNSALAMLGGGDWLAEPGRQGLPPGEGLLQAWLTVPVLAATGGFSDLAYRAVSVAAGLGAALLVYLLARRWYGRRVGLLAGALWATGLPMGAMGYLATADMLATFWIALSIFCADRVSFRHTRGPKDMPWVLALWGSAILGGLTRGWGLVHLSIVVGMFAGAAAAGPGFRALRQRKTIDAKVLLAVRLILRRWGRLARRLRLAAGLSAFVAAMGVMAALMCHRQGLAAVLWGFFFAPAAGPALTPLWFLAPATLFQVVALAQVRPSRWLARRGGIYLPVCWLASTVVFGVAPEALLSAHMAVAILGAWGIDRLADVPALARQGRASRLRHVATAATVCVGLALIAVGAMYVYRDDILAACAAQVQSPGWLQGPARGLAWLLKDVLTSPPMASPEIVWSIRVVPVVGAGVLVLGVKAGLRWDIRRVGALAVAGMLAVGFVDRHFVAPLARSGEGEKVKAFARVVGGKIGNDPFAVYEMNQLAGECYLGRLGLPCRSAQEVVALPGGEAKWLLTTDEALLTAIPRPGGSPASAAGPQMGASPLAQAVEAIGWEAYGHPDRVTAQAGPGREMLLIRITRRPGNRR